MKGKLGIWCSCHKWLLVTMILLGFAFGVFFGDKSFEKENFIYEDGLVTEGEQDVAVYDEEIYLAVGDTLDLVSYLEIEDIENLSFVVKEQAIATVTDDYYILGISEGTTEITYQSGASEKTIKVVVESVEVDSATLGSSAGLSRTYMTLIANSSSGKTRGFQLRFNGKVYSSNTWKSSDTNLVTVSKNGYVTVLKADSSPTNVTVSLTVNNTVYRCTIRVVKSANIVFVGNSLTWNAGNASKNFVNNNQLYILKTYFNATNRSVNFYYKTKGGTIEGGRSLATALKNTDMVKKYITGEGKSESSFAKKDFIVLQEKTSNLFYTYESTHGSSQARKKNASVNKAATSPYDSYVAWFNKIYSSSKSQDAMTVVYIPPMNTTAEVNASCKENNYSCNYSKYEVYQIQKKASEELILALKKYTENNSNMKGKILFAPVSTSWDTIRTENKYSLLSKLYTDERHPDAYGQYVIASSLFYTISGAPNPMTRTSDWTPKYWPEHYANGFTFGKNQINYIRKITINDALYYNFL